MSDVVSTCNSALRGAHMPSGLELGLGALFGSRLVSSEADRKQHAACETHFAPVLPAAVAYPLSTEEVAHAVRLCAEAHFPVVAYGAGTSMEGNTIPVEGGLTLDLSRMTRIVEVNEADLDCTVQAGVRREELNAHLRDTGLFFPIDPGANATLGGMAATRASGTNAVRYGTMREAVLGLTVVTASGQVIRTTGRARKSAAGYDLTRLFVGSEGTLGIITEVTVRLHGIPEQISAGVCAFDSLDGAVATVTEAIQIGVPLARIELLDDEQMRAVNRWSKLDYPEKNTLFFEFHGSARSVEEQIDTVTGLAKLHGGGAFAWSSRPEERSRLWKARHEAFFATRGMRPGCVAWTTDVCVPIGALASCIAETKQDLLAAGVPATIVGHVGDGNFHVIFVIDPAAPDELVEVERLNARMVRRSLACQGTCSGEHGIGLGKQDFLAEEAGPALAVMQAVKRALDPANIMNPGKIFAFENRLEQVRSVSGDALVPH